MQKKRESINILIIAFLILITTLGNIPSSLASNLLPLQLQHSFLFVWVLLIVVIIVMTVLTVWQHRIQQASGQHELYEVSVHTQNLMRTVLLERVRAIWIKDLLDHSLEGVSLLSLDLEEHPDLIENPWKHVLQETGRSRGLLPSGTGITQVYDEAGGELLILGEPGSGKTTLLLQLARDLLARAFQKETLPIPVIFTLSTWQKKRQLLTEWFVEELSNKYGIQKKIGKLWVETNQVLPLLDGLDEVAGEYRATCISAINEYRHIQGGSLPLVVGSRTTEYTDQGIKLVARRAVIVQSLTRRQINEYLGADQRWGELLQGSFSDDPSFQELMKNPLMLSILKKTYQGHLVNDLSLGISIEALRDQLFMKYVEQVLQRRRAEARYTPAKIKYWLIWLAHQMKRTNQTSFFLEGLQGDWLSRNRLYQVSISFAFGIISCLVTIPVNGMLFESLLYGFLVALLDGILAMLFVWLIEMDVHRSQSLFRIDKGLPRFIRGEAGISDRQGTTAFLARLFGSRLGYALFCGFLDGVLVETLVGPVYGLVHGLFYAAFYVVLGKLEKHIQPVEKLTWSWNSVKHHANSSLLQGISFGFLLGFFDAVPYVFQPTVFLSTLSFGLSVGFGIGLVIMLMRGFSSNTFKKPKKKLQKQKTIQPNQGIRNSLSNSLRLGLFSGLAFGVLIFLYYSFIIRSVLTVGYIAQIPLNSGLVYGISDGLAVAYLFWLINGGFVSVQHFVLRVHLWQSESMPWRYPQFLNYAHERILLRKIGGGYDFIHPLLLDYFANFDLQQARTAMTSVENRQQRLTDETNLPTSVTSSEYPSITDTPTVLLSPLSASPDVVRLPCGHERRDFRARFCSVCGAPVSS